MNTQEQNQAQTQNRIWWYLLALALPILVGLLVIFVQPKPVKGPADSKRLLHDSTITPRTRHLPLSRHFKILHVMSYHSPWKWTDDQFNGFKAALKDLDIEYKVIQMDTKRKSDPAWIQQISSQIFQTINEWKPDLIYTNDDNAQRYVATRYVNSDIPIVFSGVNEEPQAYGFAGSTNVTGIFERMHYTATLRLLKKLVPSVQNVAILTDTGKMWPPMIERMKAQQSRFPVNIVSYDIIPTFEQFKQKVLDYQDKVDALGFLGIFEFKDENGNNVLLEDVLAWLAQNSRLPDFSFWKDRVEKGTLCAVTVSGYAQGYEAGLLARKILTQHISPAELPMKPTEKGVPVINLATAKRLGIKPSSDVLLTAEVIQNIQNK